MQVLDRLKMELSNQEYFTDEQYTQFLVENNLIYTDEYVKADMWKKNFHMLRISNKIAFRFGER